MKSEEKTQLFDINLLDMEPVSLEDRDIEDILTENLNQYQSSHPRFARRL